MKTAIIFTLLSVATVANASLSPDLDFYWSNYKKTFNKIYSDEEDIERRMIWERNVAKIVHHNLQADLGIHSYEIGLNQFTDESHAKFVKTMNGFKKGHYQSNGSAWVPLYNVLLPDEIDWRTKGLVTPVKDQKQCGSCWSFSSTGSLEGQHMKKTGQLVSLSEQNLMDCSRPEGNGGCEGGWMDQAFEYIKQNNGVDTEKSYPYKAVDDYTCHFNPANVGATITGYVDIPTGDEEALKQAVATVGPISVAIDATSETFQLYKNGIYDEPRCSTTNLDHAVLAVGYGSENGKDYWLVKNSWGEVWGMKGYIKMSRNKNNQCGIATKASYPLV